MNAVAGVPGCASRILETNTPGRIPQRCITAQIIDETQAEVIRTVDGGSLSPLFQIVCGAGIRQPVRWPVTSINGGDQPTSATQLIALSGADVRNVECDGHVVGRWYQDDDARYCYLGGVLPVDVRRPREQQAWSCFEQLKTALAAVEMDFTHIVRTWLYLDDLLDWYGEFNNVRTAFFREHGVFNHLVPASTGIGAANPAGAAIVAGAIAIKPKSERVRVTAVQSPLQCPAIDYQSSFSRAVEVSRPGIRQLFVSGTASIAPDGTSVHVGDPARQVELTMQVVHAILRSRRMNWSHSTRMIAYFKHARDIHHFHNWCRLHELRNLPIIFVPSTVCRDELLFELELDAAATS